MSNYIIGEAGITLLKMVDSINSSKESILIAEQIEKAIVAKNWTKAELARQLEVKPSMVTKYLRGSENFTLLAKHKLQRVLGVKLGELAGENDNLKNEVAKLKETISQLDDTERQVHLDVNTRSKHLVSSAHILNNLVQTQVKGITGLYKSLEHNNSNSLPAGNDYSFLEVA